MGVSKYYFKLNELLKPHFSGVDWAVLNGTNMTVVFWDIDRMASFPPELHSHDYEQMTLIIEGEMELQNGDEKKIVRPGELGYIPAGLPHGGAVVGQNVKMFDVFSPLREDHYAKYMGNK
jgi:quercetin dioxygenase-like cupin family protein